MRYLILISLVLLAGCGEHDEVDFDLTCRTVSCPSADDTSTFQSGNNKSFSCVWHCADYKDSSRVYVDLTFWSWNGGCWELDHEYVSSGICNH